MGMLVKALHMVCVDEDKEQITFSQDNFMRWLRKYACNVNAGVFSAGAIRVLIDYYRSTGLLRCRLESLVNEEDKDALMKYLSRGFHELLKPLARQGFIILVNLSGESPSNFMEAIVNVSKIAMGC